MKSDKDKYHLYGEPKKMIQMNLFIVQKYSHRYRKQIMVTVGKGEGGVNWEIGIDIYIRILPYIWRRAWKPTPVFLPGESHGQRSLMGCSLWGHRESDMTERT